MNFFVSLFCSYVHYFVKSYVDNWFKILNLLLEYSLFFILLILKLHIRMHRWRNMHIYRIYFCVHLVVRNQEVKCCRVYIKEWAFFFLSWSFKLLSGSRHYVSCNRKGPRRMNAYNLEDIISRVFLINRRYTVWKIRHILIQIL